jgi:dihydrolipoamide dehydrogenase
MRVLEVSSNSQRRIVDEEMSTTARNTDVAIIGGGMGGYSAAIRVAQLEGKVVLVERNRLGGICLNKGCIPTVALLRSAEIFSNAKNAKEFGINVGNVSIDFSTVMKRKQELVDSLVGGIENLVKASGIEVIRGVAKVTRPDIVEVINDDGNTVVKAKKIIISTGSTCPRSIQGVDGRLVAADETFDLNNLPKSVLIIGGDEMGAQFASIFNKFEAHVTIAERSNRLLPKEDEEISILFQEIMEASNVKVILGASVKKIVEGRDNGQKVLISTDRGDQEIHVEKVVLATDRTPNSKDLGLEKVNIALDEKGRIRVNEKMETNIPGIYAVGDVVGKFMLTHVASTEGVVAAENAMGRTSEMSYRVVPRCTFSDPSVASVGLTEKQSTEQGYDVKVGRFPFELNAFSHIMGTMGGLIKIIAEAKHGEVLGVHIIGPGATELIHEAALAMKLETTVEDIANTIHGHPTLAEAFKDAASRMHVWWSVGEDQS